MTNFNSPEQAEHQQTPQEKLQKLWSTPENWGDGMTVQIEGLPEGMRAVETPDFLIIRSTMRDLPAELNGNPIRDVPIAVFHARSVKPEEIIKEVREFTVHTLNKDVTFVPPEFDKNIA